MRHHSGNHGNPLTHWPKDKFGSIFSLGKTGRGEGHGGKGGAQSAEICALGPVE
jgi:hypothetical protein